MSKLSVVNPFKPLLSEQEAGVAARAGALGAFLTAASGVLGTVRLYLQKDAMLAIVRESTNLQSTDPEVARQASAMIEPVAIYVPMGTSIMVIVIYLVFGLIQWRRRTKMIPLIMFLFSAWGVIMGFLGLFITRTPAQAALMPPGWQMVLNWALEVVILALFWAGVRGGSWLQKSRSAAPTSANPPASSAR